MDLTNLKIGILGDSITFGVGASSPACNFVSLLQQAHKEAIFYNYGISGTRIAERVAPLLGRWDKYPFYSRIPKMADGLDIIFVFGGTNDYGHGDVGIGDFLETNNYTFSGAYNNLINDLKDKYPNAKIIICTPIHRKEDRFKKEKLDRKLYNLEDYIKVIIKYSEYYHLDLIDLYHNSGIDPNNEKTNYTVDGLHPNDKGYQILFKIFNDYLNNL